MEKRQLTVQKLDQPYTSFYLGSLRADYIELYSDIVRRSEDENRGVQRDLVSNRLRNIQEFSQDRDAIFPTPIILSGNSDFLTLNKLNVSNNEFYEITINMTPEEARGVKDSNKKNTHANILPFRIIDGQHRIVGINKSGMSSKFNLPIVIVLDPDIYQEAYIFSTINSNQRPVSRSLIYDLFAYDPADKRSVEKTCHLITMALDDMEDSPFYKRIKRLGRNIVDKPDATLSQGTFADQISNYITNNSQRDNTALKNNEELYPLDLERYIFREHFLIGKDKNIMLIMKNYFNAIKHVFNEEWTYPDKYILTKSIGFIAMMSFLNNIYNYIYFKNKNYSYDAFVEYFTAIKGKSSTLIYEKQINFENQGSSLSVANKISNQFIDIFDSIYN